MRMFWKSPYTGETYEPNDPRLRGRGNPPTCPQWARDNPGAGNVEMNRVFEQEQDPAQGEFTDTTNQTEEPTNG